MFNIFGTRTPAQKAADPAAREQTRKRNAAVAQEKLQEMSKREEILTKKVQHTEKQIAAVKAEAQTKLKAGNKAGAKALLKRKIQLEKQLGSTLSMLDKMVHIKGQVENANTQGDMVDAMAQGTDALRAAHRGLDTDSVSRTMDDLQEAMEMNQEVSDAMSMPLPGQIDDFELEDDMAELDAELERDASAAAAVPAAAPPVAVSHATTPSQSASGAAVASSGSASANAAASALPMAPTAALPVATPAAQAPAKQAVAAGAAASGGDAGSGEMDDELRRLEAEMGM